MGIDSLIVFPSDDYDHGRCCPIRIPEDDAFWSRKGKTCMEIKRTQASPGLACELEFRQQVQVGTLEK